MKSSNKLNKALKDALDNNPMPLHESQWERLQKDLGKDEKKPKFLYWFFVLIPMIMVLGIGYYLGRESNSDSTKSELAIVNTNNGNASESNSNEMELDTHIQSNANAEQNPNSSSESNSNSTNTIQNKPANSNNTTSESNTINTNSNQNNSSNSSESNVANTNDKDVSTQNSLNGTQNTTNGTQNSSSDIVANGENVIINQENELPIHVFSVLSYPRKKDFKWNSKDEDPLKLSFFENKEGSKKTSKGKKNSIDPERTFFALGFATGFSLVSTEVSGISNSEKIHKDTRKLFEQSTENQHSYYLNVNFEWTPFKSLNFGLNTGIQYIEVSNDMDIKYKLNQIPVRLPNGDISFYIPISDTMNPPTIQVKNRATYRFVNVPFKIGYTFPLGSRQEIGLSGGINMSFLAGTRGNTFSLNEASVQPIRESIANIFNVGYMGSVIYSRQVYKQWWIGAEYQFQRNNLKYDMDYGILNSKLKVNAINLNFRFKF